MERIAEPPREKMPKRTIILGIVLLVAGAIWARQIGVEKGRPFSFHHDSEAAVVIVIGGTFVVAGLLGAFAAWFSARRSRLWRDIAMRRGLEPDFKLSMPDDLSAFLSSGFVDNQVSGTFDSLEFLLGHYVRVQRRSAAEFNFCLVKRPGLPAFRLNCLDGTAMLVNKALGQTGIEFEDERFMRSYSLETENERAARDLFNGGVLAWFTLRQRKLNVEVKGDHVLVWADGKAPEPLLDETMEMMRLFR